VEVSARWVCTTRDGRKIFLPSHWLESEVIRQLVDVHGEDIATILREGADNPGDITITGHYEVLG
jgi:hypothetical protein